MEDTNIYQTPLKDRYSSKEMLKLFSKDTRISCWRKLWVALAKTEKDLGLPITEEQIEELESHIEEINYDIANEREKICRHDVMAHVYAYGIQCPKSAGIIHLGATSCFVTDNSDIIILKQGLEIIKKRIVSVIKILSDFATENKNVVTLGYTHYQPAQLTTVGKRACLWIQEFIDNLEEVENVLKNLKLLGCKGTTGTQESFMKLFNGDEQKVKQIDEKLKEYLGFEKVFDVSRTNLPKKFRCKSS